MKSAQKHDALPMDIDQEWVDALFARLIHA